MSNPGRVMDAHHRIQNETSAGVPSPQRTCQGKCKRRRSYTQFDGDSTICKQCVLRTPKQQGE